MKHKGPAGVNRLLHFQRRELDRYKDLLNALREVDLDVADKILVAVEAYAEACRMNMPRMSDLLRRTR